jgi:hypothetical protein
VCRDERSPLLGGTVNVYWDKLAMPVELFVRSGIVDNFDSHALPFFEP